MSEYFMNLKDVKKDIHPGTLKAGGRNPKGDTISFTNYYMEFNAKPYYSLSGELQFSRYDHRYWEEEIVKMKIAGLNTIATYIFWIHHEEEEGNFLWEGNRNLRLFVELCAKHGMFVVLRIGPFDNGECRNGGLPDWLYGRPFDVRSNDEKYLFYVERFYNEIGKQVSDLMFKDGGPVIGIQLENEYYCVACLWELTRNQGAIQPPKGYGGEEGKKHMMKLKELAQKAGLKAPLYMSTAWGESPVCEDEILPVHGAYSEWPWTINENNRKHCLTNEYLFYNFHDRSCRCQVFDPSYDAERYPYACMELGGGSPCSYSYRFVISPESVEAMTMVKVASGTNMVSYYVFQGGSNPVGKHSLLNVPNHPNISYDFQAPLGEYGQIRNSYRYLKPLLYFLQQFGDRLTPMVTVLPQGNSDITAANTETLRFAARVKDNSGFLFLNNYQDHACMKEQENLHITLNLSDETIVLPKDGYMNLKTNDCMILPFNLDMDSVLLKYSTTQLITRIDDNGTGTWFFFAREGFSAEYCFDNSTFTCISVENGKTYADGKLTYVTVEPGADNIISIYRLDGTKLELVTFTREEALTFWKARLWGKDRILLSKSDILAEDDCIRILDTGNTKMELKLFPSDGICLLWPDGKVREHKEGKFTVFSVELPEKEIKMDIEMVGSSKAVLGFDRVSFTGINDVFLKIDYLGDIGNAFIDGRLVNDNFCNGTTWEIGLKRFKQEVLDKGMYLYITPAREGKVVLGDCPVGFVETFVGKETAVIKSIKAYPQYEVRLIRA